MSEVTKRALLESKLNNFVKFLEENVDNETVKTRLASWSNSVDSFSLIARWFLVPNYDRMREYVLDLCNKCGYEPTEDVLSMLVRYCMFFAEAFRD